ncbi:alanine racemase, partial [uncultured Ruthenibacterium sp.]|uniref:acyltransferase family protein n=1 Tax=uncultured Ruthenibacterium sp. TaxID=1905347 RepID=UPI00349E6A6F
MRKKSISALDDFRLIAAVLVIAIHTSPLASVSAIGDFWLTRVLARIAVPFFFMVTGKFLKRNNVHFLRKILLLYAVSVFLYFPLNLYAGNWSIGGFLQDLLFRGTFYHLWYFPAIVLGVLIVWALGHLERKMAFVIASILYLIGLGGDSYYGLIQQVPFLKAFYEGVFSVFGYSRNGLFFAPLFLLLGTVRIPLGGKKCFWGFTVTLAAMSAEALWLHKMGVQRHDSMYLFLPLCAVFLFSGLLAYNGASSQKARKVSMFVYILHPWCIVVVRGIAKICGQQAFLVENSLLHFGAVVFVSFTGAWLLMRLRPIPQPQNIRAWREINCTALVQNVHVLQTQAHTPVMAVVKADGYGHGASLVAHVLQRAGVRGWSVASLSEGIALRRSGIRGRILILGYTHPS